MTHDVKVNFFFFIFYVQNYITSKIKGKKKKEEGRNKGEYT